MIDKIAINTTPYSISPRKEKIISISILSGLSAIPTLSILIFSTSVLALTQLTISENEIAAIPQNGLASSPRIIPEKIRISPSLSKVESRIPPNFDAFPTYNFTTPHNILRWTNRTQVTDGTSCSSNCHIRNEGGTLINKDLFLFQDDLLEWEMKATSGITVDDKLPESWTN